MKHKVKLIGGPYDRKETWCKDNAEDQPIRLHGPSGLWYVYVPIPGTDVFVWQQPGREAPFEKENEVTP